MIISARRPGSETSALKWLILIGLLWAQIAFASHQLAHDADEVDAPCQVCASLDRLDDVLSEVGITGSDPAATSVLPPRLFDRDISGILQVYSARASPPPPESSY